MISFCGNTTFCLLLCYTFKMHILILTHNFFQAYLIAITVGNDFKFGMQLHNDKLLKKTFQICWITTLCLPVTIGQNYFDSNKTQL